MKLNFYKEMLEGLSTGVIWLDSDQRIQFVNFAASDLLQQSPARLNGQHWSKILPNMIDDMHLAMDKKITVHDYVLNVNDIDKTRVSCTIAPFEQDLMSGWIVEIFNTERHSRIVEEDERWHQYEAGNLLVRTLAHEVKNPLAGILGATQLMQRKFDQGADENRYLDIISREVLRLKNLVDSMLGPPKSQEKEWHNIHEVIRYVLDIVTGEKSENIYVKLDYDPSIPDVFLDFNAMVQAILNIVKNAIQAMDEFGGVLTIKTRVEHKFTLGSQTYPLVAMMSFIDEGKGIPKEVFDSIFYPMVSSKPEGTGLGLPISQNVLRQHDGLIVAESEPGRTVFNVYLPLNQRESNNDMQL
jgi:two-component system nitrogen regulation sensor histidine kinase GlnL